MEFLTETELPRDTAQRYGRFRPSEWESYTREAGVVEGIAQWEQRLGRLAAEKRENAQAEGYDWLNDVAERIDTLITFARDLHADLAARPEDATWAEHLAYLKQLASKYAANLEPLLDALADLETLSAVRERATFDVFCRAVRDDLESRDTSRVLNEPVRLFGRQGVAVIDASSLRHLRFRAICLVGVAERAWPPPSRPDPLLLERERRRLNESSAAAALPLRTEPDEATLSFWLAVQSARERLNISFARADAGRSGKHLPSYFFRAVAEALEGRRPLALDDLDTSAHVRRFEAGRLAHSDLTGSLSAAEYDRGLVRASYERGLPGAVEAIAADTPAFGRAVRARSLRRAAAFSEYDGVMLDAAAVDAARASSVFERGSPVSASRLQTYTECPYRYFLRYGLGIQPVEEPETTERIDHLQRGSLVHEILQTFLSTIGRDDPPRLERRAAHLELLEDIAAKAGEDRVKRGVTGRPLIWKMDKQQIDDDLARWYDAEVAEMARSPLRPGAFEARFGPAWGAGEAEDPISSDDPLELRVNGRTFRLQGRIDRIDWDDDRQRFRVIDYKTGKFRSKKDDVFRRGEALQLPIYLHAAAQLTGIDAERGESQYFHCSSAGEFKRHIITGDALIARSDDFDRILTTIADGVDGGYFGPNPGKGGEHCQWCDYKDVCDRRIERIMQTKTGDPRGDAFRALEEIE
jgi:RecB family exonuclease